MEIPGDTPLHRLTKDVPLWAQSERSDEPPEVSVVMPCLDEAESLTHCLESARRAFKEARVKGELIVADNGSTDGSDAIALSQGARLVRVREKGYGSAAQGGIRVARGKYVIMADADESYD